jgi:leucyl-tRNA synthetase
MSERSAIGLSHQGPALEWGKLHCLGKISGMDMMGLPLEPPLSHYRTVYTLPLTTISMNKGTGVVTSVPSDAPDDYIALKEMKEKPLWREKFNITEEMVKDFESQPIIGRILSCTACFLSIYLSSFLPSCLSFFLFLLDIPGYGVMSAAKLCEERGVLSSKDREKLKEIKDEVYLKGFYEGILLVGPYAGGKVCDVKNLVKNELCEKGEGIIYYEPESLVISRTGDECIVALTDQWYLTYGDSDWKDKIKQHISSSTTFNSYNPGIKDALDGALDWLKEWACSREFGLGTKLPWDEKWVIDSLSDSTVYMAYYTLAHIWHGSGDLTGKDCGMNSALFNDEVFSYIFLGKEISSEIEKKFPEGFLTNARKEFTYWYPMDLRVSAKDLIPNHLTMALYNHAEIWKDSPYLWPKGIYCKTSSLFVIVVLILFFFMFFGVSLCFFLVSAFYLLLLC